MRELLWCRSKGDKAAIALAPQWGVLREFLELTPTPSAQRAHYGNGQVHSSDAARIEPRIPAIARPVRRETNMPPAPAPIAAQADLRPMSRADACVVESDSRANVIPSASIPSNQTDHVTDIIELPGGVSILGAVLRHSRELLATTVAIPACPGATLAIDRDRSLVLFAQLGPGLNGLNSIAAGLKWIEEARHLLAMALPQLKVDVDATPRVRLLVDHADRSASGLAPMLTDARVTIQTYRQVKWGGRSGLMVE
jgi:hypothetical protein